MFADLLTGTPLSGVEKRAQSSGVNAEGGFLVPREQVVRFWNEVLDDELLSRISSFIVPYDSRPRFIRDNSGNLAVWVAEGAAIASVDEAFVSGGPSALHKLVAASTASIELMQDVMAQMVATFADGGNGAGVMAESILNTLQAKRITRALNSAVLNGLGSGSNQPLGILNDVAIPTINQAISDAALTAVYEGLDSFYAKNAVWIVNPKYWPTVYGGTTFLDTDENAQPYLLNRPVIQSEWMSPTGLIFGDLSHYGMLLSPQIMVSVDTQSEATSGKVRRYSHQRADGQFIRGTEGESMVILTIP